MGQHLARLVAYAPAEGDSSTVKRISPILVMLACVFVLSLGASAQEPETSQPSQISPPPGQSQKQLNIAAARAERKAIVSNNMYLTKSESAVFWPLYDAYESRMDKIEDRHIREIKDYVQKYGHLSDYDANRKLDEVIAILQARLDVQKEYVPKFRAVMSPIKVTRFFQVDSKLRALVQCDIAQLVPLAQAAPSQDGGGEGNNL